MVEEQIPSSLAQGDAGAWSSAQHHLGPRAGCLLPLLLNPVPRGLQKAM